MSPTIRRAVEIHHADIVRSVRRALAAGVPADRLVVLLLDHGARVGGEAGPMVCAFERDEFSELADCPREHVTSLFDTRCEEGDPSEVHAACLQLLLGPLRDHVEHAVLPGALLIIAQRGAEVGVVSRLPGTGRYLQ